MYKIFTNWLFCCCRTIRSTLSIY